MKVRGYIVKIDPIPAEDGGGFIATIPELPGCASDGETPMDAMKGLPEAIDSWIALAHKLGREVPQPHREHA
jgi:predicted RNase H-like HicB family nuclease